MYIEHVLVHACDNKHTVKGSGFCNVHVGTKYLSRHRLGFPYIVGLGLVVED